MTSSFFSTKVTFKLQPNDLIIVPAGIWHRAYTLTHAKYERVFINIKTDKIKELSTNHTNLMQCFTKLPTNWDINIVHLDKTTANRFVNLCHQVIMLLSKNNYGNDIDLNILQAELLLTANKAVLNKKTTDFQPQPTRLQQLFDYIDTNLSGDLQLDTIADHFFLNQTTLTAISAKKLDYRSILISNKSELKKHDEC